jgi:hypothetical protein
MKQVVLFSVILVTFFSSCKDVFNDPNLEKPIIDTTPPTIKVHSFQDGDIFQNQTQIPVKVDFEDDYELEFIRIMISPDDINVNPFYYEKRLEKSFYTVDTFYTLPAVYDSIQFDVLLYCEDYVGYSNEKNMRLIAKKN